MFNKYLCNFVLAVTNQASKIFQSYQWGKHDFNIVCSNSWLPWKRGKANVTDLLSSNTVS